VRAVRWPDIGRRSVRSPARSYGPVAIEVRAAIAGDLDALERVAALDEQPPLGGLNLLVAEVDGALWAGLDLDSGESVADPFVPSADAVELLRLRARQLAAIMGDPTPRLGRSRRDEASATVGA